jgi:hypothetical protein
MEFSNEDSQSYKILYQVSAREDVVKKLLKKTKEIFSSRKFSKLSVTYDNYTSNEVL